MATLDDMPEGRALCPSCSGGDVLRVRSQDPSWLCLGCGSSFGHPGVASAGGPLLRYFSGWSPWWGFLVLLVLFLGIAAVLASVMPPDALSSRSGPHFGTSGPGALRGEVSGRVWGAGEDERSLALTLVNEARVSAGSPPVVLGDNPAAQAHAESMAENCFLSHWGLDGLKPYMRYALAGGVQVNGENASGPLLCPDWLPRIYAPGVAGSGAAVREAVSDTVSGFLESPGHRDTMLDPSYRRVSLGIAWTGSTFTMVQQFEGDYVEFTVGPFVRDGVLEMAGRVRNGFRFGRDLDLVVFLFYDPPVRALGRGQLSRTYCYGSGDLVAAFAPGPAFGLWESDRVWTYRGAGESGEDGGCPDPYLMDPGLLAPDTLGEARGLFDRAREQSSYRHREEFPVPVDGAVHWMTRDDEFRVGVDLVSYLDELGPGVYTLSLWGLADGEMRPFAERSLFYYGVEPGS